MHRRAALRTLSSLATVGVAGCLGTGGGGGGGGDSGARETGSGRLGDPPSLAAEAFDDGDRIPARYTCDGEGVSPALSVGDAPAGAGSLALVVDDPDAPGGTYTHWLLWDLPPDVDGLPEGVPAGERVQELDGAAQGTNDAGLVGYSGPCPPPDDGPHTYRFRLLALGESLDLEPGADRSAFDGALGAVDRSETVLAGTYDR